MANPFETRIHEILLRTVHGIAKAVREGIADDVARYTGGATSGHAAGHADGHSDAQAPAPVARRMGRPPKSAASSVAVAAPKAVPAVAQRAAKPWPKCTVPGCENSFFGPSGRERRLCYKHFQEAGGKNGQKK